MLFRFFKSLLSQPTELGSPRHVAPHCDGLGSQPRCLCDLKPAEFHKFFLHELLRETVDRPNHNQSDQGKNPNIKFHQSSNLFAKDLPTAQLYSSGGCPCSGRRWPFWKWLSSSSPSSAAWIVRRPGKRWWNVEVFQLQMALGLQLLVNLKYPETSFTSIYLLLSLAEVQLFEK